MPLIIFMQNGVQIAVKGELISESEWRGSRKVKKISVNGHQVLINKAEINFVECIPQADYDRLMTAAQEKQKEAAGDGKSGIVRPAMMVPRRH